MKKASATATVRAAALATSRTDKEPGLSSATREARRAELVEAAYYLIADKGIEGLRTRDVAAKVGINISTLHYHFDTKEKLIAGVVDHVTHLFQTLRVPLRAGATALDELRSMLESPAHRRRMAPELEIVVNETMLHARRDDGLRATFDATLNYWRLGVEQIVERCKREGYLRDELDPATVATMITSFLMGATLQLGLRPNFPLSEVSNMLLSTLLKPPVGATKKRR